MILNIYKYSYYDIKYYTNIVIMILNIKFK